MCLNCGCGLPYEDWDDPDNITVDDIKKATATPKAKGLTADEVMMRMMTTWSKGASAADKSFRTGKKQLNTGDMVDQLMDWGMPKQAAVSEAEEIHGEVRGKPKQ